jgi:hypothetical protein
MSRSDPVAKRLAVGQRAVPNWPVLDLGDTRKAQSQSHPGTRPDARTQRKPFTSRRSPPRESARETST